MKKKYRMIYVLSMSMLSALISCDSDVTVSQQSGAEGNVTFSAIINSGFQHDTRTYLSGLSTIWNAGDQIKVNGTDISLVNGANTRYGMFRGTVSAYNSGYYAGYPTSATTYSDGAMTLAIPANQTHDASNTLLGQMPMAAYAQADANGNVVLNFKNAANILKLNLWGEQAIDRIEISSSEAYLAGTYDVTPSGTDNVTFGNWTGTSKTITLNCPTPITIGTTSATATSFYILIPKLSGNTLLTIKTYSSTTGLYQQNTITVDGDHNTHLKTNASNYLCATAATKFVPTKIAGALPGLFSVSADKQVLFSQGNLQYQASTNTWRFAEHQYDYVGNAVSGNVYEGGVKCNNANISSDYTGWIDLFGWVGASSTNLTGDYQKYGVTTSQTNSHYGSVAGEALKADWGTAIDNSGTWYTMSSNEWTYLLATRTVNGGTGEGKSYQRATINSDDSGVYGLIIYPDNYTAQTSAVSYTSSEWIAMENAGCVFLSPVGRRQGTTISNVSTHGNYWSSTANTANAAYYLGFLNTSFKPADNTNRYYGRAVRLVTDCTVPTSADAQAYELVTLENVEWD